MQSKVSMVVPCYNKVNYISEMLDSVIAQKWDNIELVLVNDGSNDGTREIISKYYEKLETRGYEVKIIDQENQGVAAAIKNGLKLASGEFVCMPDCDDLLDKEYVSAMVNALNEFPNVNCVVCDVVGSGRVSWSASKYNREEISVLSNHQKKLLKKYILASFFQSACLMMMRVSLLKKLNLIENFITNVKTTQEQQIWLPILASEESVLHLNRQLYTYVVRENSIETSVSDIQEIYQYAEDRYVLTRETLKKYIDSSVEIDFLCKLASIVKCHMVYARINQRGLEEYRSISITQYVKAVNESGLLSFMLTMDIFDNFGFSVVCKVINYYLTDYVPEKEGNMPLIRSNQGRLIAYGAGRVAKRVLPDFIKSNLIPEEVWDIKAGDNDWFCGIPLTQPDFDSLTKKDIVVLFLYNSKDVEYPLRRTEANVFYFQDILDELVIEHFLDLAVKPMNKLESRNQ